MITKVLHFLRTTKSRLTTQYLSSVRTPIYCYTDENQYSIAVGV